MTTISKILRDEVGELLKYASSEKLADIHEQLSKADKPHHLPNEVMITQINRHLREADDKLLGSVYRFLTRTISFSYQEGSTQVSVDLISDGTVSWFVRGQQQPPFWLIHEPKGGGEGGRETEGFLFSLTLREVCASEIGQDVGLIYEEVLKGLGWVDYVNYSGLPPHAQQAIKRIK